MKVSGVTVPPKRDERGRLPPLTRPERFHLARLCAAAAPETQGGFVDALTSLLGKAWSVLNVDCRFQSVDATPLAGEALIVCDTGQRRPSSLEQTSARRSLGQSAAVKLRAKMLRAVEPKQLAVGRDQLSPDEFAVASHIVGEIQRVAAAERALRDDDHRQLGQFLLQSHDSARTFLNANRPELDLLVELARAHPGCLGARQLGQGEGGATLNLVAYYQAEDFLKSMTRQYSQRAGDKLNAFVCQIVDGAA